MSTIDNYLAVHSNAIRVRSARAELLAGNLANADTPGYRPRDIDFATALDNASPQKVMRPVVTHAAHMRLNGWSPGLEPTFRDSPEKSLDENTVNSEYERIQFADNEVRYRASVQFLTQRIGGLVRAIRGE